MKKCKIGLRRFARIGIVLSILAFILIGINTSVYAFSSSSTASPGTMADDASVGTVAWINPDNAKISDNVNTTASDLAFQNNIYDDEVKIVKSDGSIGTTNKALVDTWSATEAYFSYGGSTDLWGESWAASDINDADFGVVLAAGGVGDGHNHSHYLKATNFGFTIPAGSTIQGILVEIEKKTSILNSRANVDHIRITVYYTIGVISFQNPNATSTTITLNWIPASGSTSTVVRYSATGYPATPASGTSAYSGTGTECTVTGLTAGQTYYFSAWCYDGIGYSTTYDTTQITTLLISQPSGGTTVLPPVITAPTIPSSANSTANVTGFNLEPFTGIISYFVSGEGGLGMPENNAWESLAMIGVVVCGAITYIKMKNFFIAYFVVLVLSCICWGLHLTQGYLVGAELVIGAGVWGLERFFQ